MYDRSDSGTLRRSPRRSRATWAWRNRRQRPLDEEQHSPQSCAAWRPYQSAAVFSVQSASRAQSVSPAPRTYDPAQPDRCFISSGVGSISARSEPAVVERVASELGLSGAALVAQAETPEIK